MLSFATIMLLAGIGIPVMAALDLQKTTSRLDIETIRHDSDTQNTETLPNSWRIFSSRSPYMQALLQRKLLIIRRPELSSINNVINSCPHAATETKCYCVTIELSI